MAKKSKTPKIVKDAQRTLKNYGLTPENAKVLGTCGAGLALFGVITTLVDETAKYTSSSDEQYRSFTRQFYGTSLGKTVGAVASLAAIAFMQDMAIEQKYLKRGAKRKARSAAVGFVGASLLSRLPANQLGQRFNYLASGSLTAAVNPTGNDAMMLNQANV